MSNGYKIYGRVLVKETNAGIANVVVAAFDADPPAAAGPGAPVVEVLAIGVLPVGTLDKLGDRLGSVLTAADGAFAISFDDDAFLPEAIAAGARYPKPDLVLVVFAPEDPIDAIRESAPAEQRILCISRYPRTNAARTEAYVLRVPSDFLKTAAIPYEGSTASTPAAEDTTGVFSSTILNHWKQMDTVRANLSPKLTANVAQSRQTAAKASASVANLSARPDQVAQYNSHLPGQPQAGQPTNHFVPRTADATTVAAFHETEIKTVSLPAISNYKGNLQLRLTQSELTTAGIALNAGLLTAVGNPGLKFPGLWPLQLLAARGSTVDLLRVHTLNDLIESPAEKLAALVAAPPVVPVVPPVQPVVAPATVDNLILDRIAGQLQDMEAASAATIEDRPDDTAISQSVQELELAGGPADVTAFHDVQLLQIAFRDVWTEAFSNDILGQAQTIYNQATQLYADAGLQLPDPGAIADIGQLNDFLNTIQSEVNTMPTATTPTNSGSWITNVTASLFGSPTPSQPAAPKNPNPPVSLPLTPLIINTFPFISAGVWSLLSLAQQMTILMKAVTIIPLDPSDSGRQAAVTAVRQIVSQPDNAGGPLGDLIAELSENLSEPYSFDVFAPNTYNYGILLTYRQKWEPQTYQVGNLVSTIPLAPGETRKYSKRRVVKKSRSEKASQKDDSSQSSQATEDDRAEAAIMTKVSQATNFKTTAEGSVNIGIASFGGSAQFSMDQSQESTNNIKDLHEATLKAAEEYRQERSLQVDTSSSLETEDTSSGEVSNPNNELTVTYMFYELQRRYQITEQLQRARGVIMVAQDVPSPHEIDQAWLIENQWIIRKALLDDSMRPALDYLSSGYAGDELSLEVLQAAWTAQQNILAALEQKVIMQMNMRDALRSQIVDTTNQEDQTKAQDDALNSGWFASIATSMFGDPLKEKIDDLDAQRKALKSLLDYSQSDLDDMQRKLQNAASDYQKATQQYADALKNKYSREVAIDQLRIHVKQNILYYMQAIWDHEPPDQRFFRLYNKQVACPVPEAAGNCAIQSSPVPSPFDVGAAATVNVGFSSLVSIDFGNYVNLVEIADLDNPLGYRGNYIIFPMKQLPPEQTCYLTSFMLQDYVDDYFGVRDPNEVHDHPIEEVETYIQAVYNKPATTQAQKDQMAALYTQMLMAPQPASDEIIVPTGQLYIEALPGRHPLLEDFKLKHRMIDVQKAQAEVRGDELENLRLASRLVQNPALLQDPNIGTRVVVDKDVNVVVDSTP